MSTFDFGFGFSCPHSFDERPGRGWLAVVTRAWGPEHSGLFCHRFIKLEKFALPPDRQRGGQLWYDAKLTFVLFCPTISFRTNANQANARTAEHQ
jgi:hypothetical protein